MSAVRAPSLLPPAEPTWDLAYLFPGQGDWTEEDYLALPGKRLIELSEGYLEVLPVPTQLHQLILLALLESLRAFVKPRKLGRVCPAGLPVRLWKGQMREPDILFMLTEHLDRCGQRYWEGADLAMEIVSDGAENRTRDLKSKRTEYARAGISEYWIIDPRQQQITVLRLRGKKYVTHGTFGLGERATSVLLKGFEVDVDTVLAGAED